MRDSREIGLFFCHLLRQMSAEDQQATLDRSLVKNLAPPPPHPNPTMLLKTKQKPDFTRRPSHDLIENKGLGQIGRLRIPALGGMATPNGGQSYAVWRFRAMAKSDSRVPKYRQGCREPSPHPIAV